MIPDFSFQYGGVASAELLPHWHYHVEQEYTPDGLLERRSWTDPVTRLNVTAHVRCFEDFASGKHCPRDWVLTFENHGAADTPILETVWPLDWTAPAPASERLRLHYANGSTWAKDDFVPLTSELQPGSRKDLACVGGYSSQGVLPFMNLQRNGEGLIVAVGWTGQWICRFERHQDSLHIAAGMEHIRLKLHPGEKIRTPRILWLPWEGMSVEVGQNRLRQLLLAHYLPRHAGQPILPPVADSLMSYYYLTGQSSEAIEQTALAKSAGLGVDTHWLDACWYVGQRNWWEEVGSWEANPQRFPRGLKPISEEAHRAGMKFLLWFEPERARFDSRLAQEHPEFFIRSPREPNDLLLNLGDPVAREYITDLISQRITEYGVDIYRQDFNFEAVLPFWQAADEPDRIGMAEIRHVEGLYAFWDALRSRHPGLWIDNCASGGRRIDLETISRSLPLWPSDFLEGLSQGLDLNVGEQCINAGLARWIPLFGGGVFNFTPYTTRSQIIGGFNFGVHIELSSFPDGQETGIVSGNDVLAKGVSLLDDQFPCDQARLAIREWQEMRPYVLGDFYLLHPLTASAHDWCAWQFHRNDLEAGFALAFRRHQSPFPSIEIGLRQIDPQAVYVFSVSPGYIAEPGRRVSGEELLHLQLTIPEKPGSLLLRYQRVC